MRKIKCPICGKPLLIASDDIYIDFDLRYANRKAFCNNCKRRIRFSEKKRIASGKSVD